MAHLNSVLGAKQNSATKHNSLETGPRRPPKRAQLRQPSFTFTANNQIGAGQAGYDAAGNITSFNSGGVTHQYTYDAEGRFLSVDGSTSYVYDAEGDRAAKLVNGTVQAEYLYDPEHRLQTEIGPDLKMIRGNVYVGGQFLAEDWKDAYAPAGSGTATMLRITDPVGTLRALWDVYGNWVGGYTSLPFGDAVTTSVPDPSDIFFSGKQRDGESGLDNFGARYYNSTMGRFMSPDPSGLSYADPNNPQSLNLYSYVLNNPLTNVDPTGLALHYDCYSSPGYSLDLATPGLTDTTVTVYAGQQNCTTFDDGLDQPTAQVQQQQLPQQHFDLPSVGLYNEVPADPCAFIGRGLPPSAFATAGEAARYDPFNFYLDLRYGFKIGGYLDAQPSASGNLYENAAYGNYAYGVYMASAGSTEVVALGGANRVAYQHAQKNPNQCKGREMSRLFPSLPEANVTNILRGYQDELNDTLCHE